MQHDEIRQAVRRYAKERLAPHAARWDRNSEFPREALKGLAAMGLYGVAIPEDWAAQGSTTPRSRLPARRSLQAIARRQPSSQ